MSMLIVGKTGTGKSTLCNILTVMEADSDMFPVSAEATSKTHATTIKDAFFRGNQERPFKIIDTMGFNDPKGAEQTSVDNMDQKIITDMIKTLHEINHINVFVLCVNGQSPRMDGSLVDMLKYFEGMFGSVEDPLAFWSQCVIVFTRLPMDKKSIMKRLKAQKGKTDEQIAEMYKKELVKMFGKETMSLKYLFIDACYDEEDEEETLAFDKGTIELYNILSKMPQAMTKNMRNARTKLTERK